MSLSEKFPPLYACSKCGKSVKVTSNGIGVEPAIKRSCDCPADTIVNAERKVTLRGKGKLNQFQQAGVSFKLSVRQLLSAMTGRSI